MLSVNLFETTWGDYIDSIGPRLQLAIHMVQNRLVGEQKLHSKKTIKGNYNVKLCIPIVLLVLSQCDFCCPALRFCTTRMASGKGPIITSLKKVAGQSRNKTRSHCQAGSSVKDKFLKYMRLKCCFALVICKIKFSIFRCSFNFWRQSKRWLVYM